MGLPQINIIFKTKGLTAIKRSARGIVACILKDDTPGGNEINVYESIIDIDFTHFTKRNYDYLKLIYEGSPSKVIVVKIPVETQSYNATLKKLRDLKWNYLTIPKIAQADVLLVSTWIKEERDENKKTFKAVLPNYVADHEGIINFTNDNILTIHSDTAFDTSEYCARIAGLMAGLSLARSSTYFVLPDIISADVPDDPDKRIDAGELIIVFDTEKYKIGRGVNSLTSLTTEKGSEFTKIKIIEGKDLYQDDIRSTFEDYYVGKIRNDYDNKQAFIAAVNNYHKELEGDILDKGFKNIAMIDVEAQRRYLIGKGVDVTVMDETQIAQYNTGSHVFVVSNIKFVDAMEDLTMICNM